MKRFLDILFSFIILLFFFPLGILIIIILYFSGEGEIFYKQYRIGKNGEEFGLFKFVTMVKDSPNQGAGDITLKNDPRVLPFGKILRKLKLNEFPQFINVILGDMSLVGPRPLVKNQYNMIPKESQIIINKLKPGITGIGSIIFRDEESFLKNNKDRSNTIYRDEIIPFKANLECWYYNNQSILNDLILILITIIIIFFPNTKIYNKIFPNIPINEKYNPN